MNIILCVDNLGGVLFNKRRVSKDVAVREDIYSIIKDKKLWLNEYSYKMFAEDNCGANIICDNNYLAKAGADDFCFVEDSIDFLKWDNVQRVILYNFNRVYASDCKVDLKKLREYFVLIKSVDLIGKSHLKITKEEYVKNV